MFLKIKKIIILHLLLFLHISCDDPDKYVSVQEEEDEYIGIEISVPTKTLYIDEQINALLSILLPSGEKISADNSEISWMSSDTSTIVIDESGCVTAKDEGSASIIATMGNFVATEEIYVGDYLNILLSEIFYSPTGSNVGEEFIEIYNGNGCYADFSGLTLLKEEDDSIYTLPEGSIIPPNSLVIVAHSFGAFYHRFNFHPDFSGFLHSLNNDGETISLLKPDNTANDIVYIDGGSEDSPSPEEWGSSEFPSAGGGESIQRINFNDSDTYEDWESGDPTPGT